MEYDDVIETVMTEQMKITSSMSKMTWIYAQASHWHGVMMAVCVVPLSSHVPYCVHGSHVMFYQCGMLNELWWWWCGAAQPIMPRSVPTPPHSKSRSHFTCLITCAPLPKWLRTGDVNRHTADVIHPNQASATPTRPKVWRSVKRA